VLRAFGLGFLEPLVGAPPFLRRGAGAGDGARAGGGAGADAVGGAGAAGGEETDRLRPLLRAGTAAYMYLTFAFVCLLSHLTVAVFWCGGEVEQLSHERWTQTPLTNQTGPLSSQLRKVATTSEPWTSFASSFASSFAGGLAAGELADDFGPDHPRHPLAASGLWLRRHVLCRAVRATCLSG